MPGRPVAARANFDGSLDGLRARIREEHLVEIGHAAKQPLGEHAGERGNVHLHEIGQIAVEDALERIAHDGMVAADREDAKAAEQIEIPIAVPIVQILSTAAAEARHRSRSSSAPAPSAR